MGGIKDKSHSGTVPLCHREPSVHGEQKVHGGTVTVPL